MQRLQIPLSFKSLICLIFLLLAALASGRAQAQLFCVFDPQGVTGDYYSMVQDYQLIARRWGVNLDLKVYTDESAVNTAFRNGQCDMANMIGMRARLFNKFTGTLDAPSVLENYAEVRDAMALVASPKLASFMIDDGYEVVGVLPLGACFAMVKDRRINSLERAVGKRVAILAWDPTQPVLAEDFKVTPVPAEILDFGVLLNKGQVDAIVSPILIYRALDLERALGSKGGIIRRPLFEVTMQVLTHADRFPPDFGQKSRNYLLGQTDRALEIIRAQEQSVDAALWIYVDHDEVAEWNNTVRATLDHMTRNGLFDRHMLAMLKRVRCREMPDEPECAITPEQRENIGHP